MPDSKITLLASIGTGADPANDQLVIVDVSDTSMAASGTTKRSTLNNLLASGPAATLASATITGDLTAARLIVTGATVPTNGMYLPAANTLAWATNSAEAMRLNANGLGVGVTPAYKLDVQGADNSIIAQFGGTSRKVNFTTSANGGFANGFFNFVSTSSVGAWSFQNASGTHLTIDSGGNVGIGVGTFGNSAIKVLAIGTGTEPTTGPAGSVQFFTSTRSASNTIPAIFCEGSGVTNAGITSTTVTNKIAIKVNGTIYYLLATTSAA